jgi:hypothetical protein
MPEKPQPDPVPMEDPPPHPAEPLLIETPVINMQDLEHNATPETRVSNKGVKVTPSMKAAGHDAAQEVEEAIAAIEELEKSMQLDRRR